MTPEDFKTFLDKCVVFNPAHTHYNKECKVMCDKCRTVNLRISYGIPGEGYDICTTCYVEGCKFIESERNDSLYTKLQKTGGTRRGMNIKSYRRA